MSSLNLEFIELSFFMTIRGLFNLAHTAQERRGTVAMQLAAIASALLHLLLLAPPQSTAFSRGGRGVGRVAVKPSSLLGSSAAAGSDLQHAQAVHRGADITCRLKSCTQMLAKRARKALASVAILLSILLLSPSKTSGVSGSSVSGSAYNSVDSRRGAGRHSSRGESTRQTQRQRQRQRRSRTDTFEGFQMSSRSASIDLVDVSASPRASYLVIAMFVTAFVVSRKSDSDIYNDDSDDDKRRDDNTTGSNRHNSFSSFILDLLKHKLGISAASFYQFELIFMLSSAERSIFLDNLNKAMTRYEF